ncbi:MAG: hypothetical protein JO331_02300 [Verrucomicrobia bacterium]|nr:hypothetical protein [Verrucomicrobiota bacterium]
MTSSRGKGEGRSGSVPTSVQKSYFILTDQEREVLNTALRSYRPGQTEPILAGKKKDLEAALNLLTHYRIAMEDIVGGQIIRRYTT